MEDRAAAIAGARPVTLGGAWTPPELPAGNPAVVRRGHRGEVAPVGCLVLDIAAARMGCGTVVLLVWLAARGQLGALTALTAQQLGWALVTGVLLAGYVGTWFAALARAQAVDVTAVLVLAAPITAGLSAAVNGTSLAPQTWWLALLLAGGAVALWLAWRGMPRAPEPVPVERSR